MMTAFYAKQSLIFVLKYSFESEFKLVAMRLYRDNGIFNRSFDHQAKPLSKNCV